MVLAPRFAWVILSLPLFCTPNLSAQRLPPASFAPYHVRLFGVAGRYDLPVASYRPAAAGGARDYRWEGVIVGSIAVGISAAVVQVGMCHDSELSSDRHACFGLKTLGALAFGGTIGAVLGGFIGSAIPKHESTEP